MCYELSAHLGCWVLSKAGAGNGCAVPKRCMYMYAQYCRDELKVRFGRTDPSYVLDPSFLGLRGPGVRPAREQQALPDLLRGRVRPLRRDGGGLGGRAGVPLIQDSCARGYLRCVPH